MFSNCSYLGKINDHVTIISCVLTITTVRIIMANIILGLQKKSNNRTKCKHVSSIYSFF